MYDVIVAGLGPAGATAAYELAKSGLEVLGIDKERFPRYKSCGGCISPKIRRVLDADLADVIEDTVFGATFTFHSTKPLDIIADRPVGVNVMRDRFDSLLVDRARGAGASIVEGVRVKTVLDKDTHAEVVLDDGRVYASKVVVGADGAFGVVGRDLFGMDAKESSASITAEVACPPERLEALRGRLFIDFGRVPHGYAWIFPKKDRLSIGVAGDGAGGTKGYPTLKECFNGFAATHEVLKGLAVEKPVGWAVPTFYDAGMRVAKGRALLVGDSGHLVDPFLGEGIYYAVATAKAAAGVIRDSLCSKKIDLVPYQEWVERELYPEFRAAHKLASLVYKYPRLWYGVVEAEPGIMLRYYDVIRGEGDRIAFYEWVHDNVRKRPWKIIRKWLSGRTAPLFGAAKQG